MENPNKLQDEMIEKGTREIKWTKQECMKEKNEKIKKE